MTLPPRWSTVRAFVELLTEPLRALESPGHFIVEANGPDGDDWRDLRPWHVNLARGDAVLEVTRTVAEACGARADQLDPGPEQQGRRALYYAPSSFSSHRRQDRSVQATAALVLDIDDRNHGDRDATLAALRRAPAPTYTLHSGGGVQAGYVMREAVVFDRTDAAALAAQAFSYLRVALALQALTGADDTAWPSHLFRLPGAYHVKDPERPVLVTVDSAENRRFNLEDFDEFLPLADEAEVRLAHGRLLERLTGIAPPAAIRPAGLGARKSPDGCRRVILPRLVSRRIVRLLNTGTHPKYERRDGSLDRSRATCAAAASLLGAGLARERVATIILASPLRTAIEDRGQYGEAWLAHQIKAAERFIAAQPRKAGP